MRGIKRYIDKTSVNLAKSCIWKLTKKSIMQIWLYDISRYSKEKSEPARIIGMRVTAPIDRVPAWLPKASGVGNLTMHPALEDHVIINLVEFIWKLCDYQYQSGGMGCHSTDSPFCQPWTNQNKFKINTKGEWRHDSGMHGDVDISYWQNIFDEDTLTRSLSMTPALLVEC